MRLCWQRAERYVRWTSEGIMGPQALAAGVGPGDSDGNGNGNGGENGD